MRHAQWHGRQVRLFNMRVAGICVRFYTLRHRVWLNRYFDIILPATLGAPLFAVDDQGLGAMRDAESGGSLLQASKLGRSPQGAEPLWIISLTRIAESTGETAVLNAGAWHWSRLGSPVPRRHMTTPGLAQGRGLMESTCMAVVVEIAAALHGTALEGNDIRPRNILDAKGAQREGKSDGKIL